MARRKRVTRVAIVCDEDCNWYVRRTRQVVHMLHRDEYVYYCDGPIGGPYDTLDAACDAAMAVQEPRKMNFRGTAAGPTRYQQAS